MEGLMPVQNQCVFVRTLNFDLSGDVSGDSTIHQIRRPNDCSSGSPPLPPSGRPAGSSGGQSGSKPSSGGSGAGVGQSHSCHGNSMQFGLPVSLWDVP